MANRMSQRKQDLEDEEDEDVVEIETTTGPVIEATTRANALSNAPTRPPKKKSKAKGPKSTASP
jgi:hypothetical protein